MSTITRSWVPSPILQLLVVRFNVELCVSVAGVRQSDE